MTDLDEINVIVGKLNMLEDSKEGQPPEKRIEYLDRQAPLWRELYAKVGEIICRW
jgi:hypothetical protein